VTNALIVATYAMASAAIGLAFHQFGGLGPILSALVGLAEFLLCTQVHASVLRARDRERTEEAIDDLKRANVIVTRELDETRTKMADVTARIEQKSNAQGKKIVSELQVLESLIREFAGNISKKAREEDIGIADDDRGPAADPARAIEESYVEALAEPDLLDVIRTSLEENRVDLYLQPIVSLPQRKVRFYEALSRLRAEDGEVIMPAQYIRVAAPAGLMSVVDNLLLFRCVQIVRRLTQKRRDVGVFCNISGHTLSDTEFFPQFLEYMHHHRDLAGQIVFEFEQSAIAAAGTQEEANLRFLSGLGFRLSMDQVTSLDLDFTRLSGLGLHFLKVRAETLVSGMADAHAAVAAEDFKDLLGRHGVNLIGERIEDEKTVVQLLDYHVDFGQGYLFGEPRAIRDDTAKAFDPMDTPAPNIVPLRRSG